MKKSLLFMYNPYAGKREVAGQLHNIVDILVKNDFVVTVHPTQCDNDGYKKIIESGSDFDYAVCAGGDGTLNEMVNGILNLKDKQPILGYIPCGSTNDFAKSRGIPVRIDKALENIIEGTPTLMDVGLLNKKHHFNYVAAFGLFTNVSYDTPQDMKNIFGHSAYILEGIKQLGSVTPISCTVELQDRTIKDKFLLGVVTNSASIGGFKFPVGSFIDKSAFQIILLRYSDSILDYQGIVASLLGLTEPGPQFIISPVDKIRITSDKPISWSIDGEFAGEFLENKIKIEKNAIKILLPEKKLI